MPPTEYTIHRAGLGDHLTTGMVEGGSTTQLLPFILDAGSNFQMVSLSTRLIKLTRYLTWLATNELFRTMGLEGKGFE